MNQSFGAQNWSTDDGVPAGGVVRMYLEAQREQPALFIRWQQGPLVIDGQRNEPNGCFVETVIEAAKQRLEYYQTTRFACTENAEMIGHLEAALEAAHDRTRRREERGVEGTSEV